MSIQSESESKRDVAELAQQRRDRATQLSQRLERFEDWLRSTIGKTVVSVDLSSQTLDNTRLQHLTARERDIELERRTDDIGASSGMYSQLLRSLNTPKIQRILWTHGNKPGASKWGLYLQNGENSDRIEPVGSVSIWVKIAVIDALPKLIEEFRNYEEARLNALDNALSHLDHLEQSVGLIAKEEGA